MGYYPTLLFPTVILLNTPSKIVVNGLLETTLLFPPSCMGRASGQLAQGWINTMLQSKKDYSPPNACCNIPLYFCNIVFTKFEIDFPHICHLQSYFKGSKCGCILTWPFCYWLEFWNIPMPDFTDKQSFQSKTLLQQHITKKTISWAKCNVQASVTRILQIAKHFSFSHGPNHVNLSIFNCLIHHLHQCQTQFLVMWKMVSTLAPKIISIIYFWIVGPFKGRIYVTERSQSWSGDVRLRGGFEMWCCLALSYSLVLMRFPNDKQDRNFRCHSKTACHHFSNSLFQSEYSLV